jgi:2'-5' RNA ligase
VRLFAAVDLSRETRDAMATEQTRIAASLGASAHLLKWVRPDGAHLTLVFLGHVDAACVPPIVEAFGVDVDARPFDFVFSGAGVFPPRGAPRVLWIGIGGGGDQLRALHHELAARVSVHGVTLDRRAFHPHLTLGRWSSSRPSDRARVLAATRPGALAREHVTRVTLFESRLSSSGASYTAVAHANLTGR